MKNKIIDNYLNIYKKDDLRESYENISDDELLNEINLYKKLYKSNKKSHKNITDKFNEMGNFTLHDEEDDKKTSKNNDNIKENNSDNEYNRDEDKEIKEVINDTTKKEMEKTKDDDIKDDFMIIENYDYPDKSLDLKIILQQMFEMKKLLLEYKTKIKYYKKHKLNTDHLQIKLIITLDRLNANKEET